LTDILIAIHVNLQTRILIIEPHHFLPHILTLLVPLLTAWCCLALGWLAIGCLVPEQLHVVTVQ